MSAPVVKFKRLPSGEGLPLPSRATPGAAGLDLASVADVSLGAGQRARVGVGFAIEIPDGYEGQIRPRSGLAYNSGITVLNAPGTIDADFRDQVQVVLINHSDVPQTIRRGDRIAQLVIAPVAALETIEVDELSPTERGEGGFGSTGQ